MAVRPFLHPFAKPAAEDFITIVRGEGAGVFDQSGRRYVDGLASLWYCNVGHGRAEIADAVSAQMRTLENYNTFDIFTNEPAEEVSVAIAERCPMPDSRVFLTSSGSEAVDTALKLARLTLNRTGERDRHVLVHRRHAYHGVNYGGVSVQGLPLNREGWGPLLADTAQIEHDDLASAEQLFATRGDEIAAVIAEPVIGAGGVYPPSDTYLQGLRRLCDESGALLIFDEVITGFGRLGSWFASDYYGVIPDLTIFAKAVTSGYQPLGGVIVGSRVRNALESDRDYLLRHGYTYSGHPTACAAALANFAILQADRLFDRVPLIADRLGNGLRALATDGLVAEVRGVGAIWSMVMLDGVNAVAVRDKMLNLGVIARPIGTAAIAFCPPLMIGDDDLDLCLSAAREALESTVDMA